MGTHILPPAQLRAAKKEADEMLKNFGERLLNTTRKEYFNANKQATPTDWENYEKSIGIEKLLKKAGDLIETPHLKSFECAKAIYSLADPKKETGPFAEALKKERETIKTSFKVYGDVSEKIIPVAHSKHTSKP